MGTPRPPATWGSGKQRAGQEIQNENPGLEAQCTQNGSQTKDKTNGEERGTNGGDYFNSRSNPRVPNLNFQQIKLSPI